MTCSGSIRRRPRPATRSVIAAAVTAAAFALLSAAPAAAFALLSAAPAAAATAPGTQALASAAATPTNAATGGTSAVVETLAGGALLLFAVAGLALVLRRRSRSRSGSRRKPTHARTAGAGGYWSGGSSMPGTSGARAGHGADGPDSRYEDRSSWAASANEPDWPYPDHPSWPAGSTGRPLTPDHPSWPASDVGRPIGYGSRGGTAQDFPYGDHPSWPANSPGRATASDDYPSWPAGDPGGSWAGSAGRPPADGGPAGPQDDLAGEPLAPTVHHDPYPQRPAPRVPPARGRHVRVPAGYSGYPGPGVPADDTPQRWSAQLARNTGPIPQTYYDLAFGDGRLQVVLTETPDGGPGWVTSRDAAEREIAELRATVLAMSDELRRVAAYVTEGLTSPGQPAVTPPRQAGPHPLTAPVKPLAGPDAEPSAEPAGCPASKPGAGPGAKRRARPATKPAGKPGTSAKGRQVSAMHKMVAAFVAVSVVGVVAGSAEIALHGIPFFTFRANGAGASLTGLKENQGPGQPDAPGAHHKAPAATPGAAGGAAGKAHHPDAKSRGKKNHGKGSQHKQHQGKQPPGQQTPRPGKSG
jgi:hypothetical protein